MLMSALLAALLTAPVQPTPPGAPQLFIYRFDAPPQMAAGERDLYADLFQEKLAESGQARVLSRRDIATLVEAEDDSSRAANCADENCLKSLTALGSVRFFVSAAVLEGGGGRSFSAKLYDRDSSTIILRRVVRLGATPESARRGFSEVAGDFLAALRAADAPPAVVRERRTPWGPISLFAVGGVSCAVGAGFGMKAREHYERSAEYGGQLEVAPGKTSQLVANVAYGIGGVAALAGVIWWLLGGNDSVSVAPAAGGAALQVRLGP